MVCIGSAGGGLCGLTGVPGVPGNECVLGLVIRRLGSRSMGDDVPNWPGGGGYDAARCGCGGCACWCGGGGGGTCHTDPSGCMAKVGGVGVVFRVCGCDWEGTVGGACKGALEGIGTGLSGFQTLGLRLIIGGGFAAFIEANM